MILSAAFFRRTTAVHACSALALAALLTLSNFAAAQIAAPAPLTATASLSASAPRPTAIKPQIEPAKLVASHVKAASTGSGWTELTPAQQQSLKPLATSWNTISEAQKRKWVEISKNYATLSPADQDTLHGRMNEWASLSAQQRAQARLNFAKTKELSKQLTPDEKKAKWQTYQALSAEEKTRLAQKATPRPAGAAIAVTPVAVQKLADVHPHPLSGASGPRATTSGEPKIAVSPPMIPTAPASAQLAAPPAVQPAP